jgi:hypothetical protein
MKKQTKAPAQSQTVGEQADALKYVGGMVIYDQVFARRFQLVDSAGKFRGGLGFTDQGNPVLCLTDDPGDKSKTLTKRAELVLTEEGPGLVLSDATGEHRARMVVKNSGEASVSLTDTKGKVRFCVLLKEDGGVVATTFDAKGKPWRFVREPEHPLRCAQIQKYVEKATDRDGKRGFVKAINETLGVYDHAVIEDLWRHATGKEGKPQAKGKTRTVKAPARAAA